MVPAPTALMVAKRGALYHYTNTHTHTHAHPESACPTICIKGGDLLIPVPPVERKVAADREDGVHIGATHAGGDVLLDVSPRCCDQPAGPGVVEVLLKGLARGAEPPHLQDSYRHREGGEELDAEAIQQPAEILRKTMLLLMVEVCAVGL